MSYKSMARKPNNVPTVTVTISTTPHIYDYLERLVTLRVYVKNPAEAAEQLIKESLREDLRERRKQLLIEDRLSDRKQKRKRRVRL